MKRASRNQGRNATGTIGLGESKVTPPMGTDLADILVEASVNNIRSLWSNAPATKQEEQ